jgi:hypothetical protein
MAEFEFARSEDARKMCARIREALITFGGKDETVAEELLRAYFSGTENVDDEPLIYHEVPYYHAMCILHHPVIGDDNIWWHKDPNFWPPPPEWRFE